MPAKKDSKPWIVKTKRLLKERNLTYEDLANKLGLSDGAVSHKLTDKRKTTIDEMIIIANTVGLTVSELLDEPGVTVVRTEQEKQFIEAYRRLDDNEKALALKLFSGFN